MTLHIINIFLISTVVGVFISDIIKKIKYIPIDIKQRGILIKDDVKEKIWALKFGPFQLLLKEQKTKKK
jgi:hypothetical protein